MALNFVGGVKNLSDSVSSLKKELTSVYDVLKKIKGIGPTAFGDINAVLHSGGHMNLGTGNPLFQNSANIPTPKGNYGNNTVPASQPSSPAQQNNYLAAGVTAAKFSVGLSIAQTVAGVAAGATNMLPDLGNVVARGSTYYQASAMFGGVNAMALQKKATAAMSGGITGYGTDAAATNVLTMGYNYAPGSSGMMSALGQVSDAAKSLNMDNAAAAAAVGGMATGQMGAQLYQYGIKQFDAKGNQRAIGDIGNDLFSKYFYAGKDVSKITPEQFSKDLQYGGLQASLDSMGITADQQTLMKQAFGKKLKGGNAGNLAGNPALPAYEVNQSEANLSNATQDNLVKGFGTAASAVTALNKALEGTPALIVQMKGAMQGFAGTQAGKGAGGVVSSLVNGAANIGSNLLLLNALKGGGGLAGEASLLSKGANLLKGGLKGGAIAIGGGLVGDAIKGHSPKGGARSRIGNAAKYAATGAGIGAMIPGLDATGIPELVGGVLGGLGGLIFGGASDGFSANVSTTSSLSMYSGSSSPMAPANPTAAMSATSTSAMVSAGFAAKNLNVWSGANNQHNGIDTPMPLNTPVQAQYAGTVMASNLSKDYGLVIQVDHGDGYSSIYAHLNQKAVRPGQKVKIGQVIGKSGATGNANGPHLHFEIRRGNAPIDPTQYLAQQKKGTAYSSSSAGSSGSTSVSNGLNLPKDVKRNASSLYKFLTAQGLTANGASGVVGNLVGESNLRTGAVGDGGTSYGIAQWHAGRRDNLLKFAKSLNLDPSSMEAQEKFLLKEMKSYSGMWKTLTNPKTSQLDAAGAFMRSFERPADQSDAAAARRASLGLSALKAAKGGSSSGFNTSVQTAMPSSTVASPVSTPSSSGGNTSNVYVTLQIQQANEQEAHAFAKRIKLLIEQDNKVHTMGRS